MARYLGPKCKKCRREGEKLGLRGRCTGAKCGYVRRKYAPGQHGPKQTRKLSEYGTQLRAKQKMKLLYGVLERQFGGYINKATHQAGATGDNLLKLLEKRLDNVLYRAGWARSRNMARQLVSHRHVLLNGVRVKTPSISTRIGDEITIRNSDKARKFFEQITKEPVGERPSWVEVDEKNYRVKIVADPVSADLGESLNTQLIVEFYSR